MEKVDGCFHLCDNYIERPLGRGTHMKLASLLTHITYQLLEGTVCVSVSGITNDTRNLKKGEVFVCVEGWRQDGHIFAAEAVKKGASALVVSHPVSGPWGITVLQTEDTRAALAFMSAAFYGYPAERMKVIGITGTKGKTTTAWMLQTILNHAGIKTGLVGTIATDTGIRRFPSSHTTPESCLLMKYLKEMEEAGCSCAVMEVSSQALKMKRTASIPFHTAVFTNLGEDHIGPGEHESPEDYRKCKHLLFLQCKTGIGNLDDPNYEEMFSGTDCKKITFSVREKADYRGIHVVTSGDEKGVGMFFEIEQRKGRFFLPMPGLYNVYNALAAAACAMELGVREEIIRSALSQVRVPGRMEYISEGEREGVFLDYAHNAMSLENVLKTLKSCTEGRIIAVFGCGGGRSRLRRSEMGEVAGRLADLTVVTSDNPRDELPEAIIQDIVKGIEKTKGKYCVIPDRREAVAWAVERKKPQDAVLIAGKGHETYQEIRGIKYPMDDRITIKKALSEKVKGQTAEE